MPPETIHPAVRINHRIRASSFVMGFAIIAAHIVDKDYGLLTWVLLALQFFVYPQVMYWRSRRAREPLRTETRNLLIDPVFLGAWCAALGYPLWITFSLLTCTIMNISFYRNTRGAAEVILAFFLGGAFWLVLPTWRFSPDTGWPVTLLCVVGLTLYILITTHAAYLRNIKLRDTRKLLAQSEQALHNANDALQTQIDEIHALQTQLREQANRDPLTGLYNRRYLASTLERELARCKREGQPLCLMLIDIDHFKQINDTYGHPAGDEVLKNLAILLNQQARSADVVCRYGGEEFLLLLPNITLDAALARADQWRQAFARHSIVFGELRMQAALSAGLAVYPGHGTSPEELIHCADQALYRAKERGRDRVEVFTRAGTVV